MPMAVSPDKKHLYAVVRLSQQPPRVLTYAIDPTTGALTQKASAHASRVACPMSRPIAPGYYLFTASYGGDKLAVKPDRRECWASRSGSDSGDPHWPQCAFDLARSQQQIPYAAASRPTRCCNSPSTARPASSRPTIRRRSARSRVTVHAPHGAPRPGQQEPLCDQRVVGVRHAILGRFSAARGR